jgi:hypothetical protein
MYKTYTFKNLQLEIKELWFELRCLNNAGYKDDTVIVTLDCVVDTEYDPIANFEYITDIIEIKVKDLQFLINNPATSEEILEVKQQFELKKGVNAFIDNYLDELINLKQSDDWKLLDYESIIVEATYFSGETTTYDWMPSKHKLDLATVW